MRFDQWLTELVCDEKRGEFGSWRKERNCWQNWAGFMQLPHFRMVFAMTRSVAAFPSISEVGGKREIMSALSSVSPQGSEIARQNLPQSRLFCEIWLIQ